MKRNDIVLACCMLLALLLTATVVSGSPEGQAYCRFVGMLTDSRSFLSYTRHEYFRGILCNILGRDMVEGAVPYDFELVGRMVSDICYNNAADYFGFDVK